MIQMISDTEFQLVKGGHTMTLRKNDSGWWMSTVNACTRAWAYGPNKNLGSLKFFASLADVETHYKSWRGVGSLIQKAGAR